MSTLRSMLHNSFGHGGRERSASESRAGSAESTPLRKRRFGLRRGERDASAHEQHASTPLAALHGASATVPGVSPIVCTDGGEDGTHRRAYLMRHITSPERPAKSSLRRAGSEGNLAGEATVPGGGGLQEESVLDCSMEIQALGASPGSGTATALAAGCEGGSTHNASFMKAMQRVPPTHPPVAGSNTRLMPPNTSAKQPGQPSNLARSCNL